MAASERFYHSMYNNHIGKIANLEKQLSTLDMIANDYRTSYEAKSKQYETLEVQYRLKKDDYDELEDTFWIVEAKRNTWKALTIAGIPISFVGGVLLTVKLLN